MGCFGLLEQGHGLRESAHRPYALDPALTLQDLSETVLYGSWSAWKPQPYPSRGS